MATEWGVIMESRMRGKRVEVCPGEEYARRFAANDPTSRQVVSREVTEWEIQDERGKS